MTILGRNAGTFNGTSFLVTPAAGNFGTGTVLVIVVFGNTVINTPSGFTQRVASVVDMGLYAYDGAGAGQSNIVFTNSAGTGEWFVWELSASSTWDVGSGSQTPVAGATYTSPSITPALGSRHLLALIGGNGAGLARTVTAFSDGFTEWADLQVTTQDWTFAAAADLDVTADGSTAYTTTGTYSGGGTTTRGGITLAYVNTATVTAVFPPNRQARRRLATAVLTRERARVSTPVRDQVNPPFPFTGVKQPRRLRGIGPRRGEAWLPVQPQVVVTAPNFPIQPVREHLKGLKLFRPRVATPVPAQVALVAAPFPPRGLRAQVRGLRLFRSRSVPAPRRQAVPPAVTHPRPRAQWRVRGHIAVAPPPQVVVNAPAWSPRPVRARLKGLRIGRGRASAPVPEQVTVVPPAYPPQPARTRLRGLRLFRGRASTPVPAQLTVASAAFVPRGVRTRIKALRWSRGRTTATVPPQVVVVAPGRVPLFARVKQHAIRLARGKFRTAQSPGVRVLPMAAASPLPPIATVSEPHPIRTVTGDRGITTFSPPPSIDT